MTVPTAVFRMILDPELNYSAGYFTDAGMPMEQAQRAKNEAILSRCGIRPSMRLLDVGCGWGAAVRIAAVERGIETIGITIDPTQHEYAVSRQRRQSPAAPMEFRLQPWEAYTEPVDRIICVNAFESFDDKLGFIAHARDLLPRGGKLVMLTATADRPIYRLISKADIVRGAESVRFDVEVSGSLSWHYAHTLECLSKNLDDRRQDVLKLITVEEFDRMAEFYAVSARLLRKGRNDMFEFTLTAR